ncbi:MAG: transposase [Rubritalea sp.]
MNQGQTMKGKRRRHSEEFKHKVHQYSTESSKSSTHICQEFDICPALIYR